MLYNVSRANINTKTIEVIMTHTQTYQEIYNLQWDQLQENEQFKTWVNNSVICCVTQLVETVLQHEPELYDEIENYYYCPNCDDENCSGEDCETEPREVFEWWLVDGFMYEDLKASGQPVFEYGCNKIWGRCTTGQAIICDYQIQKLFKEWIKRCFLDK